MREYQENVGKEILINNHIEMLSSAMEQFLYNFMLKIVWIEHPREKFHLNDLWKWRRFAQIIDQLILRHWNRKDNSEKSTINTNIANVENVSTHYVHSNRVEDRLRFPSSCRPISNGSTSCLLRMWHHGLDQEALEQMIACTKNEISHWMGP